MSPADMTTTKRSSNIYSIEPNLSNVALKKKRAGSSFKMAAFGVKFLRAKTLSKQKVTVHFFCLIS